jgi:predicted DNA-binding transcriptional regulator YafY
MPKIKSVEKRHRFINRCLRDPKERFPSKQRLAKRCSDFLQVTISPSTIEKDIRFMKRSVEDGGLSAPIAYSRAQDGYYYTEPDFTIEELDISTQEWESLEYAASLLYQYAQVPIFRNFKDAIEKIHAHFEIELNPQDPYKDKVVQFETPTAQTGYEWLSGLYHAIRNRHLATIQYLNIYKNEKSVRVIQPVLLREHQNKWYVVGWEPAKNDYRTYALNRIEQISYDAATQRYRQDFPYDTFTKYAVGIMENDGKPVTVEMTVTAPFHEHLLREPIHASQKIVAQKPQAIKVTLLVLDNHELHQRLLAFGPHCIVHKPVALRQSLKKIIQKMAANYE